MRSYLNVMEELFIIVFTAISRLKAVYMIQVREAWI